MIENLTPRAIPIFINRPTNVDCMRCWPNPGWGWRPTRKGKENWKKGAQLTTYDVKGVCFTCAGTGLIAIPMKEVVAKCSWGEADTARWLEIPDK